MTGPLETEFQLYMLLL